MSGVLHAVLVVIEVITSALLIGVILLQRGKAQGAGLAFGQAMGESLFGAQAGNVLTRATIILASIFMVNTTILALLAPRTSSVSVVERTSVPTAPALPPAAQPMPSAAGQLESLPAGGAGEAVVPVTAEAGPVQKAGVDEKPSAPAQPVSAAESTAAGKTPAE